MQSELNRNNVYQSVKLLLLVPMLFLLAIPKCLRIFKENVYHTSVHMPMCTSSVMSVSSVQHIWPRSALLSTRM